MLIEARVHLPPLSRSLAAVTLALIGMTTACTLPRVRPVMAPEMASGAARPRTVAVLPPDLALTVKDSKGRLHSDRVLNARLLGRIQGALVSALIRRGYQVRGVLGHDGRHQRASAAAAPVVHPADLGQLRVEIEQVSANLPAGPGLVRASVSADLTQQVRQSTGADASLYARGWVYVAPGDSKAAKAAKVIGITLLVLVLVGLVVVLAASKGGGGIGKMLGGALKVAGHAAVKTAQVAGRVAIRVVPHVLDAAARTPSCPTVRCLRCERQYNELPPLAMPALAEVYHPATSARRFPKRSSVGIGVSLVDNDTGGILWHAGQTFRIEAQSRGNLERLVEHYLKELPRAR